MAAYDRKATMDAVCERMVAGKSLRQVCREEGMPSKTRVMAWLNEDESLRDQYARARDALADEWFDEMRDVAFDDADDPNNKRVKLDMLKWTVSKLAPKKYGDKLTTEHQGPDGGPMVMRWVKDDEPAPDTGL